MSMDSFAPSRARTTTSTQERRYSAGRAFARRESDRRYLVLASLASWLANAQFHPLFIVDKRMTIHLLNEAAERLVQRTNVLRTEHRLLLFRSERIRNAISRTFAEETPFASFPLRIGAATSSVAVTKLRLPGVSQKLSAIEIRFSDREIYTARLKELFGLTRAESEIALAIFDGCSLVRIANDRDASLNTIKTQTRHVFQKCRVHSQVALTRRLSETLMPHGQGHFDRSAD